MTRAIVYGDISPNVIDGSSIWLISITENLAHIFEEVHLLLKMKPQHDLLIGRLNSIENVVIHEPNLKTSEMELTVARAAEEVSCMVEELHPDVVLARGMDLCDSFSLQPVIAKRLWSYITDLPFPLDRVSENALTSLKSIALKSRRVLAQTEGARSYIESIVPETAGKTLLMRPMVPNGAFVELGTKPAWNSSRTLQLVYAGKLAEGWKTLELLRLPTALREMGINAELRVVGDKFNRSRRNPRWVSLMQAALREVDSDPNSGVTWLGGLSRSESLQQIANADIGIGWRTAELDGNVEFSTKALEYSAAGAVPLVNRTNDNIEFFGADYPFFVGSDDDVTGAAKVIAEGIPRLESIRTDLQFAAEEYSFASAQKRLSVYFERAGTIREQTSLTISEPRKALIAAHDFKFLGELIDQLRQDPSYDLRFDEWDTLHSHNADKSRELAAWADVVFCEWAGPNLKWYSNNIPEGTKLVSRLHGFELRGRWLEGVNFENVNSMVFVSDFYRQRASEQLGLKAESAHTIPNMVDLVDFDRPKMANANFNIGMVGMVPFLKRPDRALNLLERLLRVDDRFTLFIKGRPPWEYPYEWEKPLQKQAYLEFYNRLSRDKSLARHVVFEPFGPAMASWFRNIGVILSPSDQESFHLSVAEGMASRAVPIVWERDGSREVFGNDNVYANLDEACQTVLGLADRNEFNHAGEKARARSQGFDLHTVMTKWHRMFL